MQIADINIYKHLKCCCRWVLIGRNIKLNLWNFYNRFLSCIWIYIFRDRMFQAEDKASKRPFESLVRALGCNAEWEGQGWKLKT